MFRYGLKTLINHQINMEVVGEAENGQPAVKLAREFQPDVILMGVNMPVMDGIEATRQIHSEMPDMKILALSMDVCDCYKSFMMRAGALGYIVKGGESEELCGAIRRVVGTKNLAPTERPFPPALINNHLLAPRVAQ